MLIGVFLRGSMAIFHEAALQRLRGQACDGAADLFDHSNPFVHHVRADNT